jgi:hypothetical protein
MLPALGLDRQNVSFQRYLPTTLLILAEISQRGFECIQ